MSRGSCVLILAPFVAAVGCIPTPQPFGVGDTDGIPFDATDPYVPGETDSPDPGTTGDPTTGAEDPSDTDGTTSGSGSDGATDGDTDGDTDPGPTGSFPPPEPFGDDVQETDLVGVWGSPWDTTGVADFTITIAGDGAFEWRETSADCGIDVRATGRLWVESTQIVFHVYTWDKRMPWNTEAALGITVEAPFRLRIGYSPMGGFMGLAGPRRLTDLADWAGRSYDRVDAGMGPEGRWIGESEMWALVDGEVDPQLIVRERFIADLLPGADATLTRERRWWWPGPDPVADEPNVGIGGWVDQTPGNVAGAATVIGTTHAYDAVHMFSFRPELSLKLGVESDCVSAP